MRSDCATTSVLPIEQIDPADIPAARLLQRKPPPRTQCRLPIHIRKPHPVLSLRQKASHLKNSRTRRSQKHHEKNYRWIRQSCCGILLPSEIAFAFGRGGSYSGSRGNFSSSNRYGGSQVTQLWIDEQAATHTAAAPRTPPGQGTTHDSAYGTSTSHNEGGGTTHTNAYGGKTWVNMEKVRRTRMPTAARRRLNPEKVRVTQRLRWNHFCP